ncbi:RNA-guided pseudouridylation complex pseudouridine synthase subunit Cbf5 [Candidatus Woesearchaeota archaeon]|nr:RNA-guided pseudouridylation complex pseudouridine synthase subunit Cbf5 [Candidatus Woesearchaeota archaeon]
MERKLPFETIQRKVIVRKESDTSDKFGYLPDQRPVDVLLENGIINIDKPAGPTSHQTSAYVKQILGISKAGHSGTLDPQVTGVLPVGIAGSTKVVHVLLTAGKEYVCLMHVHKNLEEKQLKDAISNFLGKIKQLPPIKSAVKRQLRERSIYYLDILETEGRDVLFRVGCEAGTYIRKLVDDIGKKIGGAHMAELRRTKAGPFGEDSLVTLQDLTDATYYWKAEGNEKYIRHVIQPVENAVKHLPKVWIMDSAVDSMAHGASLKVPGISKVESGIRENNIVAVMTLKGELVSYGTARMSSEGMLGERGVAVKTERVFMKTSVYPRIEKAA